MAPVRLTLVIVESSCWIKSPSLASLCRTIYRCNFSFNSPQVSNSYIDCIKTRNETMDSVLTSEKGLFKIEAGGRTKNVACTWGTCNDHTKVVFSG